MSGLEKRGRLGPLLGGALLVAVLGVALWRLAAPLANPATCDLSRGPCEVPRGAESLLVEVDPRPLRAGRVSQLTVRIAESPDRSLVFEGPIAVELEMPGMEMGDHRTVLEPIGPGVWRGPIELSPCPLGGSLWRARLRFPDGPPGAELTFDVAP